MNNVAILTINDLDNYGNRLQAYAANIVIKKLKSNAVNLVELKNIYFKLFVKMLLIPILPEVKKNEAHRLINFYKFTKRYIKQKWLLLNNQAHYDYYFCGSDQIWNPNMFKDAFYFAQFTSKDKRISYAASFGVSNIPEEKKEFYKKNLKEMKTISVREEAGAKIVKELTGRTAEVHVDPTMLLDKSEWIKISQCPKYNIKKKYILTYFLGKVSGNTREYIKNIAVENDLDIISLEGKSPNKYWYNTDPAEFLWLIEHCSLMCTDSFHGSVFSVLMEVPFIVFDRVDSIGNMSSRLDTLLSMLKLEDRRFNNQQGSMIFEKNYDHIPAILERERRRSIDYLKKAMELE